jgi:YHS domain-containing protein
MKPFLFFLAILFTLSATAQKAEVFQTNGLAIHGYDPVAFFLDQKPVKGSMLFTTRWREATWQFASRQHLDAFLKDPERYAPQYGGYCAYGTAGGYKASTEIDTWTIVDNKLYFNYNQKVKGTWSKDIPGYIRKADGNWPQIRYKS